MTTKEENWGSKEKKTKFLFFIFIKKLLFTIDNYIVNNGSEKKVWGSGRVNNVPNFTELCLKCKASETT